MARLTRRQLLIGGAALAATPSLSRAGTGPKKLMIITAMGGWDPTFVFVPSLSNGEVDAPDIDEDPNNPEDREATRTYGDVEINVNDYKRPSASAFFERYMSKSLIVNGIWTGAIAHTPAQIRILTGMTGDTSPDFGVIAGSELGRNLPLGTVDMSGRGRAGHLASTMAKVGHRGQLLALVDPMGSAFQTPDESSFSPSGYVPSAANDAAIRNYLRGRVDRVESRFKDRLGHNEAMLADWRSSWDRAELLEGEAGDLLATLELGVTPTPLQASLVGIDMLERGLCSTIMIDTAPDWDTHAGNVQQHGYYEAMFIGLTATVAELDARGMLDDTLVCVLSEMIRTPRITTDGGKGHWPHATALLVGGGVSGGRVIGGYDSLLQSLPMDLNTGLVDPSAELLTYDRFVGGILEFLDVDPQPWLPGVSPLRALR